MLSTQRNRRRGSQSSLRQSSNCNIQKVLISLLAIWFLCVVFFVIQVSRDPPSHIPPPLVQTKVTNTNPISFGKQKQPEIIGGLTASDNSPVIEIKGDMHDHAIQFQIISQKLESQKNLPKEQRRIYSDIKLPELPFNQPREVYEEVKREFKAAQWQPPGEERVTPKPTSKPTETVKQDIHNNQDDKDDKDISSGSR